jgi:hypothetical protein
MLSRTEYEEVLQMRREFAALRFDWVAHVRQLLQAQISAGSTARSGRQPRGRTVDI